MTTISAVLEEIALRRPDIADFAVGISLEPGVWYSAPHKSLDGAKIEYDIGLVELPTGRFLDALVKFAIPRKVKAERSPSEMLMDPRHMQPIVRHPVRRRKVHFCLNEVA